jgi:hypothetical protein
MKTGEPGEETQTICPEFMTKFMNNFVGKKVSVIRLSPTAFYNYDSYEKGICSECISFQIRIRLCEISDNNKTLLCLKCLVAMKVVSVFEITRKINVL